MESLLLMPSSFIANTLHSRPNSAPKPPTRRCIVSCNGAGDGYGGKVDRRNVLLGIGGLYGAGTLTTPKSTADPLPPVDMNTCKPIFDPTASTQVLMNCCPPKPEPTPRPYILPQFKRLRFREAVHLASPETLEKFNEAIDKMKELPAHHPWNFIQQANVHCAYCDLAYKQTEGSDIKLQIHTCNMFFPWHRWYLYFYERILGKLIKDPTFALPFWNWDHPDGMVIPDIFTHEDSTLYDPNRDPNHYPPEKVDLQFGCHSACHEHVPEEKKVTNNLIEMHREMIDTVLPADFLGANYVVGTEPSPGGGSVELGSHNSLHLWVGSPRPPRHDMGDFATAGRDPIFFTHHANIDRLWSVWNDLHMNAGRRVNDSEADWLNSEFLFYDADDEERPTLVKVKVSDALDNEKMGYTYQKVDNPWKDYRPRPASTRSSVAKTATVPNAADPAVFPAKLDKVLKVVVDRPRKSRSQKEKKQEQELLVIEGIEVDAAKLVRFLVFVNDENDKREELVGNAEYAGRFSQVPHRNPTKVKTKIRLGLNNLLEALGSEDDDKILVSVVPDAGGKDTTIGGIKIIFDR